MKRLILCFFFYLIAIQVTAQLYFPPKTGNWESTSPDVYNWCPQQLDSLHDFLEEKETKAFIVLKGGKRVVEWHFDDFSQDSLWYWASAGKSLMSVLVGIAEQEGYLSIEEASANYLGENWTNCAATEADILIKHQLSMTTGLDDAISFDCTLPACLTCQTTPNTRWAYHNAPYSLLRNVVENATGQGINAYYASKIGNVIGANGAYVKTGFNSLFFSTPRAMARFGLLMLAEGRWENTVVLNQDYYQKMISPSQHLNPSYGYLWWLNGQGQYKQPGLQFDFLSDLIPSAPDDLIAGMGKNEQRVYIVPSEEMVVVRMGNNADDSAALALSGFDDELWTKIMDLPCQVTQLDEDHASSSIQLFPNPSSTYLTVSATIPIQKIEIITLMGQVVHQSKETQIPIHELETGMYFVRIFTQNNEVITQPFLKR